jgi:hypothetical protein
VALMEIHSNIHDKICQDKMFGIKILSVNRKYWGSRISDELIAKSIQVSQNEKISYAKVNCVNEMCRKFADQFEMTLGWSAPYTKLFSKVGGLPAHLPEAPHNKAYVYYTDMRKYTV